MRRLVSTCYLAVAAGQERVTTIPGATAATMSSGVVPDQRLELSLDERFSGAVSMHHVDVDELSRGVDCAFVGPGSGH